MSEDFSRNTGTLQDGIEASVWLEALPHASLLLDAGGIPLHANSLAVEILGDPVGKSHDEWKAEFKKPFHEFMESGEENPVNCPSGEYSARLKKLDNGLDLLLMTLTPPTPGNGIDPDHEKKLKKAIEIRTRLLKVADEKYRKLYEESSFGIIQLDPNGDWISANPTFLEMTGNIEKQLPDQKFEDLIYSVDRKEFKKYVKKWLGGYKREHRCRLYHPDGRPRYIAVWGKTLESDGKDVGIQLCVIDDTESTEARLSAEEEKNKASEFLENIIESMLEALVVLEPSGRISRVNKAAAELLGYSEKELAGKPIGMILAGDEDEDITQQTRNFARSLKTSMGKEVDLKWKNRDGKIIPVGFTTAILRSPQGGLSGILGIARDQRENRFRRKLEETNKKLANTLDELKAVDAAKDDLISMVGHELRTPLTSIRGFAEFLCDDRVKEKNKLEYANVIVGEIDRLTRMVNDILDLAKLEAGKLRFNMEHAIINDIVKNCVIRADMVASKRGIKINADLEECPPVLMDVDRIKQVVDNLLSNAIKFSEENGEIKVSATDHKHFIKVIVRDFGVGISVDQKSAVFNKFEQTPEGRKMVGTGLGMPISRSIIEDGHRGVISFESEGEGKGTAFFFNIPKNINSGEESYPGSDNS